MSLYEYLFKKVNGMGTKWLMDAYGDCSSMDLKKIYHFRIKNVTDIKRRLLSHAFKAKSILSL